MASVTAPAAPTENLSSTCQAVLPTPTVPTSSIQPTIVPESEDSIKDPKYEKLEAVVATLQDRSTT